jgi:phage/plasmid-like protein (TIGR03299 family)
MAHNLNYNERTQKHSFFSVSEKAWHGLGTIVEAYPTSAEALKFAGLDYSVEKRSLFTMDALNMRLRNEPDPDAIILGACSEIEVPNYFATVRKDSDTVLGVVGKDYSVVQNIEAFEFFDSIVGGGEGILYETAGALGKGERIFITAKLPSYIKVGKDDLIEQYLFLTTSHDGFGSITAAFTPVRIVCNNTLNAALKNSTNSIRIRHSSGAGERLKTAHTLMGISGRIGDEMEQVFNHWANVRISDAEVKKLIQIAMAPNREVLAKLKNGTVDEASSVYKNIVDDVFSYAMANPSQLLDTTKGTLFGAYNAVTGYYQNVRRFKDGESKFKSILEGTAKQRGQSAFDLCLDLGRNENISFQLN